MGKKEREQLKERLLKMVVNEPRPESMPPITMAEVMINSMSKPNLEPLLDFISQELDRAREEGRKERTDELKQAFHEVFYKSGELWFDYIFEDGDTKAEQEAKDVVEDYWDEIISKLTTK